MFIGIQGAGKSEFYKQHFYKTHIRLNLDMLKTRYREQLLVEACLQAKQPLVIDNTNPTAEDRQRYIDPAKIHGFRVIGYYFRSSLSECMARNRQREGKACVPAPAIAATHKKLQLPRYEEGFDRLYYVYIDGNGTFVVEEYQDEI